MLRYITDQLKRFFPILLIPLGLGLLLALFSSAGTVPFYFGIGFVLLILIFLCYQVFSMMGNLMNHKKAGTLDVFLSDYQKARFVGNGLRMGEQFIFSGTECFQYSDIRSLHASRTQERNHNGGVMIFYDLDAGVAGGRTVNILRLSPNNSQSPSDANLTFTRIMNEIAGKNPSVRITPPKF